MQWSQAPHHSSWASILTDPEKSAVLNSEGIGISCRLYCKMAASGAALPQHQAGR